MIAGRAGSLEVVGSALGNVRFGSKADIPLRLADVRFTPKSGHWNSVVECLLCAKSRLMHCSKLGPLRSPRLGERERVMPP